MVEMARDAARGAEVVAVSDNEEEEEDVEEEATSVVGGRQGRAAQGREERAVC